MRWRLTHDEVTIRAVVRRISTVGLSFVAGVHGTIGVDGLAVAVVLKSVLAVRAVFLHAAACLSADTDASALLYVLDVLADLDGFANDLVADNARVGCRSPS
jgi:hypothetical protein